MRLTAVSGIVTSGGGVASGNELRERHRTGNGRGAGGPGCRGDDDTKSVENVSARSVLPSRQSLLDLVSSKFMGRHTPTHHYYHAQQQQVRYFVFYVD